jgi:hypothetical protein
VANVTITAGASYEVVTPHEMRQALLDQDARNRATIAGIKHHEVWVNAGKIGAANPYTLDGSNSPAAGWSWLVMLIGCEQSASANTRVYKQTPQLAAANAPIGFGRFVGLVGTAGSAGVVNNLQMSKGQCVLNGGGDTLTFVAQSGTVLSIYMSVIQCPTERIGELLL